MKEPKDRQVRVKRVHLLISDSTSTKRIELPDQSSILDIRCFTEAASAGAALDVGISTNDDYYVAALDVASAQMHTTTVLEGGTPSDGPIDVYMHIQGAPIAGGPFDVFVIYTCESYTFR